MHANGEQRLPACPTVSAGAAAPRGAHRLAVGAPEVQSLRLHASLPPALLQQAHAGRVEGGPHIGSWSESQAARLLRLTLLCQLLQAHMSGFAAWILLARSCRVPPMSLLLQHG